jgi:hypothetical protein
LGPVIVQASCESVCKAIFYPANRIELKVRNRPNNRDLCVIDSAKIHKRNGLLKLETGGQTGPVTQGTEIKAIPRTRLGGNVDPYYRQIEGDASK